MAIKFAQIQIDSTKETQAEGASHLDTLLEQGWQVVGCVLRTQVYNEQQHGKHEWLFFTLYKPEPKSGQTEDHVTIETE